MQKLLSFLVVFFSFLSLSAGWGDDLCEDVTCSGHGECHEDGENEWCVCDEGYIADGLECVLGCNGVTCSGHGTCSVVSGAEVCSCEAGFYASGLNCILNEASTVDTLAILNEIACYNTGNCHYRLIFATNAYDFTPALSSLYDIIVNVLDSENVWHNYRKTVAQCVTEGVCDNVDAQYIDFWFQHDVSGNQYITVEVLGNGDDAGDDMYHDVLIDYCYGVDCGTGGSCDDSLGYPVCSCDYGYVLRGGICEEGWFEDENLAAAVVELLQREGYEVESETDIDPEMLEGITHLALRGKNISSLVGIGHFSSLAVLDISENHISDLSPLADCTGLKVLNISGNPVNDLTPLAALPLFSLDVSYSGIYNFNPLLSNETLSELILADTVNGRYGTIRPEARTVPAWLQDLNLLGCNGMIEFQREGDTTKFGVVDAGGGCPAHGSCVDGKCVCDDGYTYYAGNNSCFNPNNCGANSHPDINTGVCFSNTKQYDCGDLPENANIVSDNNLYWNTSTSRYEIPAGYTTDLCHSGDPGCELSICRWECRNGYFRVKDDICAPAAEKEIPAGAYNRLILPDISRQDAVLEPVPGVSSFAPVLRAEIYHDINYNLSADWHLELPRVELNISASDAIIPLYEWDHKKVYVHMPVRLEEYSIETARKCFNSDDEHVNCDTAPNIDHVEVTYYPAPGQNIFSYIVLETTKEAFYYSGTDAYNIGENRDAWKITRYGDDGSVTEFERKARRPYNYEFMDYIPISKHVTRDKKETLFKYKWVEFDNRYSKIESVSIIDPLQRVIHISSGSGSSGLMGEPDPMKMKLYTGLKNRIEISVGRVDENNDPETPLKKVAEYEFSYGFPMEATIYRNGNPYRQDTYSEGESYEMRFKLESRNTSNDLKGRTIWDFDQNNGRPEGYTERKLVRNDSGNPEYIVKKVSGKFKPQYQWKDPQKYSLSNLPNKTVSIYSHEKNGVSGKKKIVEDYFTDWLQPGKRAVCPYNSTEKCNLNNSDTTIEEIKYNVSGSPIYFKNADNQVTVNLYNTTAEVSPEQYTIHFFSDPLHYSNAVNLNVTLPVTDFIRADNLRKSGTPACSAVYSLDTATVFESMLSQYVGEGLDQNSGWCSNASDRRVTNYEWQKDGWDKPYDLKTVTYPDGKEEIFTYDYEITSFLQLSQMHSFYTPNGKVWGRTVTGSDSLNSLQTCYAYDRKYNLMSQGLGSADNCDYKKGFSFNAENDFLMTSDYSYDENYNRILYNDYIYDDLGRKLVERNSAGVSTVYVYDSLDRVVFTFFGCNLENTAAFDDSVYTPYNFEGDDSAGENGTGVSFTYNSGEFPYARYINLTNCEYYRKYKYDEMSNLVETDFFEYLDVNADNQIEPLDMPRKITQLTEYDMLGRAVRSCQSDILRMHERCIETEHDIFGNIVKKEEKGTYRTTALTPGGFPYLADNHVSGEVREITYDLRNRPLTVTVDGLQTEQYSYNDTASDGYFGNDAITNKYGKTLTTYRDKWNRAAKQTDPFGNETVTTYESNYSDNIISQITTTSSEVKTGETTWTYDDLDRKLSETRKQFIPGSENTTTVNHVTWWEYDGIGNIASVESSDGTKQAYSYDTLNRPVETINYEKINSNWVETSSSENSYDANGRLSSTETTRNNQTITEDYGFDTFGRVTSVKTTDSSTQNPQTRYRVKFYNTGGQVIWEADEESNGIRNDFNNLNILDVEVGNQKYYTYNAFGDLMKTVYVMTDSGTGLGSVDLNPWLNDSQITTNFVYDIFGRITSRTNDRSGVTEYRYYDENPGTSHSLNKLKSIQIFPALTNGDTDYTDPGSVAQTYTYTYDEKGDESSVEYTEGNSYSMEVAFTRDAFGRITGKTSNGSVPVTQTFTYNNRNLLETATDTVGNAAPTSVTRLYDSFGNPYSESITADNVTKTVSRRMTDAKTYQFTYPDGKTLRKTATGSDLDSIEYNNSEIASYSRADGVLTAVTKGQNLIETFSYNSWNMLDNHTVSNANADIYDISYSYSRGWHLVEKADGIRNTSDKYTYDSYYRLKEVKYDFANNTAARTDSFFADGVHNIEQSTENGTTFAWGVDKLNRLREKKVGSNTESAYEYDERNNMISEDRSGTTNDKTYIYDDLNRLIEVKDGSNQTIATYTYDAFNRRITKTVGNTTERYSYDDWDIVEIATNSGNYTNIIDSGMDRHIAIEVTANNTSTLYYFLTDERGNVTALTDANGNVLERYRYRVYGDFEILDAQFAPKDCNNQTCYATNLHNFLWGGSLYEPETGLYWMRNRYYHIDMHRFINQDPIGIWGDANNLGNGFAYVAGMVIEASDPSGLEIYWDSAWITDAIQNGLAYSETFSDIYSEVKNLIINMSEDGESESWVDFDIVIIVKDFSDKDKADFGAAFADYLNSETMQTSELADYLSSKEIEPIQGVFVIYVDTELAKSGETDTSYETGILIEGALGHEFGHPKDEGKGMINNDDPDLEVEKKNQKNAKKIKEELEKSKKEEYPVNPDSSENKNQSYFANQFIKKILEMRAKKSFSEIMEEVGPVIKYDDNGRKVFFFNPYYRGKDPMKQIFWKTKNADGTKGFVRNPFAPGAEYGYDFSTYQKWQQKGFAQPNVDPYWQ